MNKRGAVGEIVFMLYRLILITIIAFIIFGIYAVFYTYYIDVRHSEAEILSKNIADCLSPQGVLDLSKLNGNENKILDYCGIKNTDRFYVNVTVTDDVGKLITFTDASGNQIKNLQGGDSGLAWVKAIYDNNLASNQQYEPGFYRATYKTQAAIVSDNKFSGGMIIEVLVNNEF